MSDQRLGRRRLLGADAVRYSFIVVDFHHLLLAGLPAHAQLSLARIRRRRAIEIAQSVADGRLSSDVLNEVLERADGNPLFIEEITRSLIEVDNSGSPKTAQSMTSIPATLHGSLVARLDRLATEKDIAQVASVIGRTFNMKLLALASERPVGVVREALGRLASAGIIYSHPSEATETYEFKHALIRDAAYDSLTRGSRSKYHRAIAECLEEAFSQIIESDPGLVARHYVDAEVREKAVPYLLKAGKLAHAWFALSDAADHLRRGMKFVCNLPANDENGRIELQFQLVLGLTLAFMNGYSSLTTAQAFERPNSTSRFVPLCKLTPYQTV